MTGGWPWALGAMALAGLALFHWLSMHRTLAVSGRFTALVDRARHGAPEDPGMTEAEMIEALRAATAAELDARGLAATVKPAAESDAAPSVIETPVMPGRQPLGAHVLFLGGTVLGGFLSMALAGRIEIDSGLRGELFARTFGEGSITSYAVLVGGGLLVGFGTRMAAGCTSGHGLCGVSRLQRGSLVATTAFFGMGVVTSLLLEKLLVTGPTTGDTSRRDTALTAIAGVVLGFCLSRIGFSSWDEVHRMFVFDDLRLFLTFIGAVVILGVAWPLVRRAGQGGWVTRPIHRGTLIGGALFGIGWALAGACPGIATVQLGEGQLGAVFTLGGIFAGNWLYSVVHERWLRWSTGSCADG